MCSSRSSRADTRSIEGVPGTAKTLLVRTIASAMAIRFTRIQFTPDLMPADVTGVALYRDPVRGFEFQPGPVFTDLLLADEINRAPAKTQAALLEAMAERQVTADGVGRPLDTLFTVLATQNPVEHEGTFPLPEAQLDRFLMKIVVGYPPASAELADAGAARVGVRSRARRKRSPRRRGDHGGRSARMPIARRSACALRRRSASTSRRSRARHARIRRWCWARRRARASR